MHVMVLVKAKSRFARGTIWKTSTMSCQRNFANRKAVCARKLQTADCWGRYYRVAIS